MPQVILPAAVLAVLAFFCNLPLGRWRAATRKFSWQWFLAVHLSIPLILGLRLEMGVGPWFIPLSIGAAVTGQLVGGRVEPQSNRAFRQK
jgi:hypothetical protein